MTRPGLFLCTHLARQDADGDPVECDCIIDFAVESYIAGSKATWTDPAWGPEYEFSVTGIEFDGPHDDAPGPLTEPERATLTAWFDAHHNDACEAAEEQRDDFGDRADYLYDRMRDEQMMERHNA